MGVLLWCHLQRHRPRDGNVVSRYLYVDLPTHVMRNVSKFCLRAHLCNGILPLAQWKWILWQALFTAVQWGACSCHYQKLICVLSLRAVCVCSFPFLPAFLCGGLLHFACLALSDCLRYFIGTTNLLFHLRLHCPPSFFLFFSSQTLWITVWLTMSSHNQKLVKLIRFIHIC